MVKLADEHKDLGKLLLEEGLINENQLKAARQQQQLTEKSIGRVLVDMGLLTEHAKITFLHAKFDHEIVDIQDMVVKEAILTKISRSYAEKHRCAAILIEGGKLVMAMEDPVDILVLDEIKTQTGMEPVPVLAPIEDIESVIQQYPAMTQGEADALQAKLAKPLWWRLARPLGFFSVLFLPWVFFIFGMKFHDQFGNFVMGLGTDFDIRLYLLLSWSLWAIVTWEIEGLIFGAEEMA